MTQERVSRLEGAYEQVDRRLDDMNRSIQSVRDEMGSLRGEMGSLRGEMNSRINNLYVLLGGTWVATMAAIIGLYFKS